MQQKMVQPDDSLEAATHASNAIQATLRRKVLQIGVSHSIARAISAPNAIACESYRLPTDHTLQPRLRNRAFNSICNPAYKEIVGAAVSSRQYESGSRPGSSGALAVGCKLQQGSTGYECAAAVEQMQIQSIVHEQQSVSSWSSRHTCQDKNTDTWVTEWKDGVVVSSC